MLLGVTPYNTKIYLVMALLLSLETATQVCSVALAKDGEMLAIKDSSEEKSHSTQITIFIEQVLEEAGLTFKDVEGVAVSKGPGSYTGLRIGVSTAKGLCYGLDIPLMAVSTLKAMALGVSESEKNEKNSNVLFCPMIDARRMEVYNALYDVNNEMIEEVNAAIVDEIFLRNYLEEQELIFFGDGMAKCETILKSHENASFLPDYFPTARNIAVLAEMKFKEEKFEELAYFEPFFLKDFVAVKSKKFNNPLAS